VCGWSLCKNTTHTNTRCGDKCLVATWALVPGYKHTAHFNNSSLHVSLLKAMSASINLCTSIAHLCLLLPAVPSCMHVDRCRAHLSASGGNSRFELDQGCCLKLPAGGNSRFELDQGCFRGFQWAGTSGLIKLDKSPKLTSDIF
jgi:hypothetical protein